jgi:O-methyltransferase
MNHIDLLNRYPIISDQISRPRLGVVLRELEGILDQNVPGDIAEFGCYIGTTSLFIRRLLDIRGTPGSRQFYAYDSFAGLPDKTAPDQSTAGTDFKQGELSVSKRDFLQTFHKANLRPPITRKTWFGQLTAAQLPSTLAFAFLDGDFYQSILDSLRLTWPRLLPGGVITVDDYQREALPGVTIAVRDFFGGVPQGLRYEHNIGIIKKP